VIGVVTTSYPRFPDDGAGVFVRERVRALLGQGQAVEILAAGEGYDVLTEDGAITRIGAGPLFYAGGAPEALEAARIVPRLAAWGRAAVFSLAMLGQLARRAGRWDAVESHWLVPCGLIVGAALPRLPHRAHVHGGDLHLLARLPGGDSMARVFCRSHPELVFASASLRESFVVLAGGTPETLGANCRIEAAPFDRSIFRERTDDERQRARAALRFGRSTLLAAGRLQPIKGFDRLIEALAQIAPEARPVLLIAGEGPEKARLMRSARALGVELHLPGALGQRLLAEHMIAADLFVHPCRTLGSGRSEGMPLVVREALACGLPVIASDSGGLGELRGTHGLTLVEAGNVAALAAAIMRVLHPAG
jgi:glycosyltransferase involved in cell wall biosynthesis